MGKTDYNKLIMEVLFKDNMTKPLEQVVQKSRNASSELKNIGSGANVGANGVMNLNSAMGLMGKAIPVISLALAVKTTAQLGLSSLKAASEVEELKNVLNQVFGNSVDDIDKWSSKLDGEVGRATHQIKQFSSLFGNIFKGSGIEEVDFTPMSKDLTKLAIDMGSFFNVLDDEAFNALKSGISGESEPLKRFGIIMNETTLAAYALKEGYQAQYNAMSEAQKQIVRYNFLMENTAHIQGDAERTIDSFANQVKLAQGSIDNISRAMGSNLIPAGQAVMSAFNGILGSIEELTLSKNSMDYFTDFTTQANEVRSLGAEYEYLSTKANLSSTEEERRMQIYNQLLSQYPSLMANISSEASEYEKVNGAIGGIIESLKDKIRLQIMDSFSEEIAEETRKAIDKSKKLLTAVENQAAEMKLEFGINTDELNNIFNDYIKAQEQGGTALKDFDGKLTELAKVLEARSGENLDITSVTMEIMNYIKSLEASKGLNEEVKQELNNKLSEIQKESQITAESFSSLVSGENENVMNAIYDGYYNTSDKMNQMSNDFHESINNSKELISYRMDNQDEYNRLLNEYVLSKMDNETAKLLVEDALIKGNISQAYQWLNQGHEGLNRNLGQFLKQIASVSAKSGNEALGLDKGKNFINKYASSLPKKTGGGSKKKSGGTGKKKSGAKKEKKKELNKFEKQLESLEKVLGDLSLKPAENLISKISETQHKLEQLKLENLEKEAVYFDLSLSEALKKQTSLLEESRKVFFELGQYEKVNEYTKKIKEMNKEFEQLSIFDSKIDNLEKDNNKLDAKATEEQEKQILELHAKNIEALKKIDEEKLNAGLLTANEFKDKEIERLEKTKDLSIELGKFDEARQYKEEIQALNKELEYSKSIEDFKENLGKAFDLDINNIEGSLTDSLESLINERFNIELDNVYDDIFQEEFTKLFKDLNFELTGNIEKDKEMLIKSKEKLYESLAESDNIMLRNMSTHLKLKETRQGMETFIDSLDNVSQELDDDFLTAITDIISFVQDSVNKLNDLGVLNGDFFDSFSGLFGIGKEEENTGLENIGTEMLNATGQMATNIEGAVTNGMATGANMMGQVLGGLSGGGGGGGLGGLFGSLGGMFGGIGTAFSIGMGAFSIISGFSGRAKAKAKKREQETQKKSEEALQKNIDEIQEVTEKIKSMQDATSSFTSSLISSIGAIPTVDRISKSFLVFETLGKTFANNVDLVNMSLMGKGKRSGFWSSKKEWKDFNVTDDAIFKWMGFDNKGKGLDSLNLDELVEFEKGLDKLDLKTFKDFTQTNGSKYKNELQRMFFDDNKIQGDWQGQDNIDAFKEEIKEYVKALQNLREAQETFFEKATLSSMEGVNVQELDTLREQYKKFYEEIGLDYRDYADDIEKSIKAHQVLITATQDVRSSFISAFSATGKSAGEALSSSFTSYFSKMINNVSGVIYDTLYSSADMEFTTYFENFTNALVDAKKAGEDISKWTKDYLNNGRTDDLVSNLLNVDDTSVEMESIIDEIKLRLKNAGLSDYMIDQLLPTSEMATQIQDALSTAMSTAIDGGSFDLFHESLGEGIYNSVKNNLMQAFLETTAYENLIDKFFDISDYENKLSNANSFEDAYNIIADALNNVNNALGNEGLGFGKENISNSTESSYKYNSITTPTSTIGDTYEINIHVDGSVYAESTTELAKDLASNMFIELEKLKKKTVS